MRVLLPIALALALVAGAGAAPAQDTTWELPATGACIDMGTGKMTAGTRCGSSQSQPAKPEPAGRKKQDGAAAGGGGQSASKPPQSSKPPRKGTARNCRPVGTKDGVPVLSCEEIDAQPQRPAAGSAAPATPPKALDYQHMSLFLVLPQTRHLARAEHSIVSWSFMDFRRAQIVGRVRWRGQGREGVATGVPVVAHVLSAGEPVARVETRTDRQGRFSLTIGANPHGLRHMRRFYVSIERELKPSVRLPGAGAARAGKKEKTGGDVAEWRPRLATNPKYLGLWNRVTRFWARVKDLGHRLSGGKGTPYTDEWDRNHRAGRDYRNALKFVLDASKEGLKWLLPGLDQVEDLAGKAEEVRKIKRRLSGGKAGRKPGLGERAGRDFREYLRLREQAIEGG